MRGLGKLTDENMAEALGEVRKALLSADVHFKVARDFTERVRAECVGLEVVKSVTPGQQVVKIISDELVKLLGAGETELSPIRPLGIMMVGLHGSGKTTTSAKLAALLRRQGIEHVLVTCATGNRRQSGENTNPWYGRAELPVREAEEEWEPGE